MLLRIAPNRLVSEVQDEFNQAFPYLKLEFFQDRSKPKDKNGVGVNKVVPHHKRIGDCQPKVVDGLCEIQDAMKVSDLEKKLKEQFGLNVQVFRHSGTIWLQTTITDNWTLQKQNEHGMELAHSSKKPLIDEAANDEINYD